MKKVVLSVTLALMVATAGEQFAMSDADRAMYEEMLENNPADIFVAEGGEIFEEELGGEEALAKFLGIEENALPKYIATFPRYIEKLGNVVGVDQVLQAMMAEQGKEQIKLKDPKMFAILAYVKSLANDEQFNIDINANEHMKASYELGKQTFMTPRGGRGLSCNSCHNKDTIGLILRTQPLPDLAEAGAGATWPAYRMTKSSLRTLQRRFQGCMNNALMAVIPIGSKEMVGLELYVSKLAQDKQKAIAVPGLKR
ncbi:MAG: sulfur oxidation c-type cytochrome SoxA [Sulfurovum sp.]|nr:sulfur oxidation c-type cytochrome SoxA [Sulfurovum sp.]